MAQRLGAQQILRTGGGGVWRQVDPVSRSVSRVLCTKADGEKKPRVKKVRSPDSPYVQRRTEYLNEISHLRKMFLMENIASRMQDVEAQAASRATVDARKAERKAAKWAQSDASFAKLQAERVEDTIRREERRANDFKRFKERCAAIDASRLARVATLQKASETWVTEQNLQDKIDELLDAIFIAQEAADHARLGTPDERRNMIS